MTVEKYTELGFETVVMSIEETGGETPFIYLLKGLEGGELTLITSSVDIKEDDDYEDYKNSKLSCFIFDYDSLQLEEEEVVDLCRWIDRVNLKHRDEQ